MNNKKRGQVPHSNTVAVSAKVNQDKTKRLKTEPEEIEETAKLESTVDPGPPVQSNISPRKKEKKPREKKKAPTLDSNWARVRQSLPITIKARADGIPPKAKALQPVAFISTSNTPVPGIAVTSLKRQVFGLDCEMVGGERGVSLLARVCVVDERGGIVYDRFVKPPGKVIDFRTQYSGVKPHHISSASAVAFESAQAAVAEIIRNNIVVGHSLKHDFDALRLEHPAHLVRDTAHYMGFKSHTGHTRKLKILALEELHRVIQEGRKGHDPADDAKAALDLYLKYRHDWESRIKKGTFRSVPAKL